MTKVNVLSGGTSAEREVSLRSGAAVAKALAATGYDPTGYDVAILDPATATIEQIADCDVVFPVLHGVGGEDGTIQSLLEQKGVKYVGSGPAASQLCFDKWQYRQLVEKSELPCAEGALVQSNNYASNPLASKAHVLKPVTGGSSIDTYIVRDPQTAPHAAIKETFDRYPTMLIETLIEGTELTVGVLGEQVLPIIEIIPPEKGEFDYENKYNGATQELCPPKNVSMEVQLAAQELAFKAHKLTGCRDFSRTDIMLDKKGNLYLLETNTIPGMTAQSLFPKMAATAGFDMQGLCIRLVSMALSR